MRTLGGWVWGLTGKEHEGIFLSNDDVLYYDRDLSHTGT